MYTMIKIINTAVHYKWKLREYILRFLITKEEIFFISLVLYLYEMLDVHQTNCGNYFMIYIS